MTGFPWHTTAVSSGLDWSWEFLAGEVKLFHFAVKVAPSSFVLIYDAGHDKLDPQVLTFWFVQTADEIDKEVMRPRLVSHNHFLFVGVIGYPIPNGLQTMGLEATL